MKNGHACTCNHPAMAAAPEPRSASCPHGHALRSSPPPRTATRSLRELELLAEEQKDRWLAGGAP